LPLIGKKNFGRRATWVQHGNMKKMDVCAAYLANGHQKIEEVGCGELFLINEKAK
jgi:hypothetical protein